MISRWVERFNAFFDKPQYLRVQNAILSGVLLALAFPKFSLGWLAWFALLPILFVLLQPISARSAFFYSLFFGTTFYGIVLYWVIAVMREYGYFPLPLAILFYIGFALLNGLNLAVFGLFARKILTQNYFFSKRLTLTAMQISILNSLAVGALWVTIEYWQTYMYGGFPWCLLGYSLVDSIGIMQLTTVTGIYGVSFIICVINVLLAHALYQRKRPLFWGTAIVLALLLTGDFAVHFGLNRAFPQMTSESTQPSPAAHSVAILQMNIPQDTDWNRAVLDEWLGRLNQMLQSAHAEIVVMPENPAPFYYPADPDFTRQLEAMVRQSGSTVIAGVVMSHKDSRGNDGVYNSAATLAPDGHLIAEYDKQHLVPFGEYVPFRRFLTFAGKLTNEISDFTAGDRYSLSVINGNEAAVFICYEAIFPNLVRHFTLEGAELLINITNDGWYGYSAAPHQHFEMARVRAIENRRFLVRSANTGISAIIDPYGRVDERTPLGKQVVSRGWIEYRTDQTFYVRYGDVFARLCVVSSTGLLILIFVVGRRSAI